ncbi:hypothetical protein COS79_03685 [Candidatus Woesearchaeota archaeon CG06_land_8_20_14_3_00_33_13]|nr:MAG: hypothetical protein COV14_04565 [Candidatus Woesearchaeota archaeon CG10_big_fil_rev_8_21_14_0_10_33_12]PIU72294.1 MAG: hypothetical protein COS79_03685 [Candidatus Woesearchaeota archaeon CG06_land_8_20_14_3_00_33_13]
MQESPETSDQSTLSMSNIVNSLNRRLRVLEERHSQIQRKTEVIEDNMINNHKEVSEGIKKINSDIKEMKRDFEDIKENMRRLIKEVGSRAKKEDVDVIQKYLDLWNPTNFVTNRELDKAVKRIISEK